ncbi:MAG: hypothetical protein U0324_37625 [Polyangiales bacterium]
MKRASLPFLLASLASCATTGTTPTYAVEPEPQLPNSTPQTALPLPTGIEVSGQLGCGQVAWYSLTLPDTRVIAMNVYGQALENALGATVTLAITVPTGQELGRMTLPVFARSPNWDPREQQFQPPAPGQYFVRAAVDPNGCQRVAMRLMLR